MISLKKSFVEMVQRLPMPELSAAGQENRNQSEVDADQAVKECKKWLSQPSNTRWLLNFDNVDRDYRDEKDPHAYNLKTYLPGADHGSILVTSRLANLGTLGTGIKVDTVTTKEARQILNDSAGLDHVIQPDSKRERRSRMPTQALGFLGQRGSMF